MSLVWNWGWQFKDGRLKSIYKAKIRIRGLSKKKNKIQIMIIIPDPNQDCPAFSKAQDQDSKDMEVLCNSKTKLESIGKWDLLKKKHIQSKIKMPKPQTMT